MRRQLRKQLLYVLRQRIRGNVEILRLDADQQISHAAADEERLKAALAQPIRARAARSAKFASVKWCAQNAE